MKQGVSRLVVHAVKETLKIRHNFSLKALVMNYRSAVAGSGGGGGLDEK